MQMAGNIGKFILLHRVLQLLDGSVRNINFLPCLLLVGLEDLVEGLGGNTNISKSESSDVVAERE